jgi:hypothetical protein
MVGGVCVTVSWPASIARLIGRSLNVGVGPPLFARTVSMPGSSGLAALPNALPSVVPMERTAGVPTPTRLLPPLMNVPVTSAELFPATIVFLSWTLLLQPPRRRSSCRRWCC